MTKQAIPSEADKIKEALYERFNGTLIVTDDDAKKFQECQAAGFSFESAVGLCFQVKTVALCVKNAAGEWQMKPTIDPRLVGAAVDELKRLDALGEKVADIVEADRTGFLPRWASKQKAGKTSGVGELAYHTSTHGPLDGPVPLDLDQEVEVFGDDLADDMRGGGMPGDDRSGIFLWRASEGRAGF